MLELATLTIASLAAGFVNAIAGGGGLIAVPVLFSVFPAAAGDRVHEPGHERGYGDGGEFEHRVPQLACCRTWLV